MSSELKPMPQRLICEACGEFQEDCVCIAHLLKERIAALEAERDGLKEENERQGMLIAGAAKGITPLMETNDSQLEKINSLTKQLAELAATNQHLQGKVREAIAARKWIGRGSRKAFEKFCENKQRADAAEAKCKELEGDSRLLHEIGEALEACGIVNACNPEGITGLCKSLDEADEKLDAAEAKLKKRNELVARLAVAKDHLEAKLAAVRERAKAEIDGRYVGSVLAVEILEIVKDTK